MSMACGYENRQEPVHVHVHIHVQAQAQAQAHVRVQHVRVHVHNVQLHVHHVQVHVQHVQDHLLHVRIHQPEYVHEHENENIHEHVHVHVPVHIHVTVHGSVHGHGHGVPWRYTVEKANLNCRASVNFLLPCQEGQLNWDGKIVIHAVGGTFSWWNWQSKFSISVKNFSHCLKLSQWKISRSNQERFGERGIGVPDMNGKITLSVLASGNIPF